MARLKDTYAAHNPGHGRMRETPFSPPTLVGEVGLLHDEEFRSEQTARKLSLANERVTASKWRSCPHCRLAGYLALFIKGHSLREHLRDHVLAQRLDLPSPIPAHAQRFCDIRKQRDLKKMRKKILASEKV